jgi:hypothetical protein
MTTQSMLPLHSFLLFHLLGLSRDVSRTVVTLRTDIQEMRITDRTLHGLSDVSRTLKEGTGARMIHTAEDRSACSL